MQMFWPHLWPTEPKIPEAGLYKLCFNKPLDESDARPHPRTSAVGAWAFTADCLDSNPYSASIRILILPLDLVCFLTPRVPHSHPLDMHCNSCCCCGNCLDHTLPGLHTSLALSCYCHMGPVRHYHACVNLKVQGSWPLVGQSLTNERVEAIIK